MTGMDVLQSLGLLAGGSGLSELLRYFRGSKKDAQASTLAWHAELMKEQREWRETLRREISVLQEKLTALQAENAGLLKKIAELEAHNDDLKRDNAELEARVMELERELKKHDAAVVTGQ